MSNANYQYDGDFVIPAGINSTYDIVHNIKKKCNLVPTGTALLKDDFEVLGRALIPGTAFHTVWVDDNTLRLVNDSVGVCIARMHIEYRHSLVQ